MRVLLDTQLLLWALAEHRRLPKDARRIIEEADVYASAASIWEIAIKFSLGKLDFAPDLVREAIGPSGFDELPVTSVHAAAVAGLPWHHRDPFDRLLLAQARTEPLVLLTTDAALAPYGPPVRVFG